MSVVKMDPCVSTDDVPSFPVTDGELETLERGRARVASHHVQGTYVAPGGACCAMGSIVLADNDDLEWVRNVEWHQLETSLSRTAAAALARLDRAALALYPELAPSADHYLGRSVEMVSEHRLPHDAEMEDPSAYNFRNREVARERVLACYDYAMASRREEL